MGLLRLLGADQSTVLFDFDDSTGAANPSSVITNLSAGLDMGTIEPHLALAPSGDQGASLVGWDHPPVEMTIGFTASATTDDNLWAGLGQLARYLVTASEDHPIYLEWSDLTTVRYIDVIAALNLPQLLRGQSSAAIVSLRKNSLGPIPLRLLRQPWMRRAQVSVSGVTVPSDPATSTKVRVYPATVTGDLPTLGRVRVQMDTGATVERVLIAARALRTRPSTYFSTYLSDTGFLQCEATGRGWTITLGTDTTSTANANGSGGNVARVTHNTNGTVLQRRVRATRTTNLDSLRGSWDVWCRLAAVTTGVHEIQLRWGPSTADPPAFANDVVSHNTNTGATTLGFVELNLGRIHLPTDTTVALGGLALEIWTRDVIGGADDLDLDFLWFTPTDQTGTVVVSGASAATTQGNDLTTPPYKLTADAVWVAGSVSGDDLILNAVNEGGGLGPNAGTDYPDGTNVFGFEFFLVNFVGTLQWRVVSVGGGGAGSVIASNSTTYGSATSGSQNELLTITAAASTLYQAQAMVTAYTSGSVQMQTISHFFTPSLGLNESVRTDPRRPAVDRLDSSGNIAGYLGIEGDMPVVLHPGEMHLMVRCDEVPLPFYEENENKLARTPTVSVIYDPKDAM